MCMLAYWFIYVHAMNTIHIAKKSDMHTQINSIDCVSALKAKKLEIHKTNLHT